jgi:hypothetical protein
VSKFSGSDKGNKKDVSAVLRGHDATWSCR